MRTRGQGRVDLFVNHETSKVPFPYVTAAPTAANGENDFDNAQVSRLILNQHSAGVLNGSFVIPSSLGYQRFCSNYLATAKEGFSRDILFTNEESPDYVFRQEESWPPPIGSPAEREAGLVVALDVRNGKQHPIYGMGRHNHENAVAIPGYGKPVVLSGDDTFTSGPLTGVFPAGAVPAQSQLYSYIAPSTDALLADEGDLWAFVSDTPGVKNYYDVAPGSGHGRHRPFHPGAEGHRHRPQPGRLGAEGRRQGLPAATDERQLADRPPLHGSGRHRRPPVGARVLERHQQRVPVRPRRGHRLRQATRHGERRIHRRLGQGPDRGPEPRHADFRSTNGRVWKMVLDPDDPKKVTSLTVFVEGDDNPVKTLNEVHQPDNIETTRNGLLMTEDPGSSQQFPVGSTDPNATTARLWHVPIANPAGAEVVAKVDQSADGRGDGRRRETTRQPGGLGVDRHRRRLRGLRPRSVPDQRPGTHALGRAGARVTTTTATVSPTSPTSAKAGSWR